MRFINDSLFQLVSLPLLFLRLRFYLCDFVGVLNGQKHMTEEEKIFCEDRSRTLLMKSVDQREARVKLDAAMQAVINKSASDVIKVRV